MKEDFDSLFETFKVSGALFGALALAPTPASAARHHSHSCAHAIGHYACEGRASFHRHPVARRADKRGDSSGAQTGGASYYGGRSHRTAGGGLVGEATCAHRTLPFGTKVLVTNLANALQAVLTVNDRGPFVRGRIVDVSIGAAGRLGMLQSGTAKVRVEVLGDHG